MGVIKFSRNSSRLFLNKIEAYNEIKDKTTLIEAILTYLVIFLFFSLIIGHYSYKFENGTYSFLKIYGMIIGGYSVYLFTKSFLLFLYSNFFDGPFKFFVSFKFVLAINLIQTCLLLLLFPIYIYGGIYDLLFSLVIFLVCIKPWGLVLNLIIFRHLSSFEGGKSYFINLLTFLSIMTLIGVGIYFLVDYMTIYNKIIFLLV